MMRDLALLLTVVFLLGCPAGERSVEPSQGSPPSAVEETAYITLGSTTSTRDSGLLAHLTPLFEARTGIAVRVIAVGTGRALEYGRRGDVDLLLVHHRPSEDAFVAEGYSPYWRDVMYNDFVIVGPPSDPAGVRGMTRATEALATIAKNGATFVSRGDDSGTHKAELALWSAAGVDPVRHSGSWYREIGSGMGAALNIASEIRAYLLTDRGTWVSFRNRSGLEILLEGDPTLRNPYSVMPISAERHPHVKLEASERFIEWLVSEEGQAAIDAFRVDGERLFFAHRSVSDESVAGSH